MNKLMKVFLYENLFRKFHRQEFLYRDEFFNFKNTLDILLKF